MGSISISCSCSTISTVQFIGYNNSILVLRERVSGCYGEFGHSDGNDASEDSVYLFFIYFLLFFFLLITHQQNHNSTLVLQGTNVFLGHCTFLECSCFTLALTRRKKTKKNTAHSDTFSVIIKQ